MRPPMENVTDRLPRANDHLRRTRPISAVDLIVVHYRGTRVEPTADPMDVLLADARHHINKNWAKKGQPKIPGFGLMYHYGIAQDGRIFITQPETLVTWHANGANGRGIGIECQLGKGQTPTQKMLLSLEALLNWLCYEQPDLPAGRANVWGHGELGGIYGGGPALGNSTECPGPPLLQFVKSYRLGQSGGPTQRERLFPETGYTVRDSFLKFYDERGGLALFGYPVSEQREEQITPDWRGPVQWFERARFEQHGSDLQPDVQLGLVGAEAKACRSQ